jgi:23S rRNA pseudouridine2457 synthase
LIPVPDFKERTQKIRDERHGPTSWISITLKEGKFRQVRKMTAAVGYPTLRLVRIRIGSIVLGNLELGEVKEVKSFFNF